MLFPVVRILRPGPLQQVAAEAAAATRDRCTTPAPLLGHLGLPRRGGILSVPPSLDSRGRIGLAGRTLGTSPEDLAGGFVRRIGPDGGGTQVHWSVPTEPGRT